MNHEMEEMQQRRRVIRWGRRGFLQHTEGGKREDSIYTYFLTSMAGSIPIIFRPICSDFFCICETASVFVAALAVVFIKSLFVSLRGLQHMLFNSVEAARSRKLQMLFCVSYQEETLGRLFCLFTMRKANCNRSLCSISSLGFLKSGQELCSGALWTEKCHDGPEQLWDILR